MQKPARTLAMTGLLAALTCAATLAVRIPSPSGGYLNLGDALVLLSAWLLGPWYGAAAAGIGSALADLIGYPLYAPATLLIKGGMAAITGLLLRRGKSRLLPTLPAEALMILGYWGFDGVLLGSLRGAAVGILSNLTQAAFGVATFLLLSAALGRSGAALRQASATAKK